MIPTIPYLHNKKILLGITGSIAAYKSVELIRKLKELGADVRVILSAGANAFITPLTLHAISGNPVFEALLDVESETSMSHIALARWADLILIAPATAHLIAKLAHGLADDLLTTACLAATAPIAIAPAMNVAMWSNEATQENIKLLTKRKIQIIGPDAGVQACGETGDGRMTDPTIIAATIVQFFQTTQRLFGKKVLITAGPTQEAIDPVRYLTNQSSGKMGYAIAKAAAAEGAEVTLITGPTALDTPLNVNTIAVVTAQQMFDAVLNCVAKHDIFIASAAVADYRPANISMQKIKKSSSSLTLKLERTPDILSSVAHLKVRPLIIGFAAETNNLIENARLKLREKKLDMILANEVGPNKGFNCDYNELIAITAHDDQIKTLSFAPKEILAQKIIEIIINDVLKIPGCPRKILV
jgi:phosphopantothenoylcysteine decarboxylase/phosphopantothenate--cysteine ligase